MARETAAERQARIAVDEAAAEPADTGNGASTAVETPPDTPETPSTEDRVAELEAGQQAIIGTLGDLTDAIGGLAERLQTAPAATQAPVAYPEGTPLPEDVLPRLPEGVVRFRSLRFTEPTYIMIPGFRENVNGRDYYRSARQVDFTHGIADVRDAELIEFMRTHPEYGLSFVEDDSALPMRTGPVVVDGPRGAGHTPRDQMAAAAGGTLTAPL